MAELSKLRRVGGAVESHRSPSGPRVLLPGEIQLCEAVGLSEEDYWEFVRINEAYTGKRGPEYDHIPDIRNEPVSTTTILVNLVIGLALTAVSMLLAPKPRTPEERDQKPDLETADRTSNKFYAPQSQFDSIQKLGVLGSIIPLVYCQTRAIPGIGTEYGGVRVNSTLLWSHMLSLGRSQQLRALMLFSHGPVVGKPDFGGFALGDLLLENYALGKLALYFRENGGRFNQVPGSPDLYTEGMMEPPFELSKGDDPFAFRWGDQLRQFFSGSRSPTTQAVFGSYACLPNGNKFKLDYELLLTPSDASDDVRDDIAAAEKRIRDWFPRYGYVLGPTNGINYIPGDRIRYELAPDTIKDDGRYGVRSVTDIRESVDNGRKDADTNLVVGETYLIGSGFGVLIEKQNSPWTLDGEPVVAIFKATTSGFVDTANKDDDDDPKNLSIQRVAVATISNNRPCNRTDITIKSTVYRKINGFANVNSQPPQGTIVRYEEENANIRLGQLNVYNRRQSFFALQYRKKGSENWINITPNKTGFVVDGQTPEAVYNQIFVIHPGSEPSAYEYQLAPIAGSAVGREWAQPGNEQEMYWLSAAGKFDPSWKQPAQQSFTSDGFTVYYTGYKKKFIGNENGNPEWQIFGVPAGEGYEIYGDVAQGGPNGETVNLRAGDAWQDFVVYDSEELSNETTPEHEVVNVNEVIIPAKTPEYQDLAYAGIRLNSGVEWSTFSELSAYFKYGIQVLKAPFTSPNNKGATNLLPEIAYDLLTNTTYGAGDFVGASQVDAAEMATAAVFCQANRFFWDGVIGERVNLREWIYQNAGYCLLQFRIKGGRFSLYPDVPFTSTGVLNPDGKIVSKAMFTDSTVSSIQVSFLSPEERQLFKATALWRENTINGFPQTRTVIVELNDEITGKPNEKLPEETFDMSSFCTSQEHAETFAKYALKTRQLVDHGVKFQTTPQMAMGIEPGEYFQLATSTPQPATRSAAGARLRNGSIDATGRVIALDLKDGRYDIQYWRPGTEGIVETSIDVRDGTVNAPELRGVIFAMSTTNTPQTRTYKLESLTYGEDGLVEIAGSYTPLVDNKLAVLQWDGQFTVTEG